MSLAGLTENTILMFGSGEIFPIPDINDPAPAGLEKVINIENFYVELKKTLCKSLMVPERSQTGIRYNLQVLNFATGGNFFLKMLELRKFHDYEERVLNKELRQWDAQAKYDFQMLLQEEHS